MNLDLRNHLTYPTQISINPKENIDSLNSFFMEIIKFLSGIQYDIRKMLKIDENGKINIDGVSELEEKYGRNELIERMNKEAREYLREEYPEGLDGFESYVVVLGTVVLIYNSQNYERLPKGFLHFNRALFNRGDRETKNRNGTYFSVIAVDLNEDKRLDGVSPSTTLHHELQHHLNSVIGDELLEQSGVVDFPIRKILRERGKNSESKEVLESLFGRAFKNGDFYNYVSQMHYLDELSASFGQKKDNVLGPLKDFYNNIGDKGTHYEIIGDDDEDILKLKSFFENYIMPAFGLFGLKYELEQEIVQENQIKENNEIEGLVKREKIRELKEKLANIEKLIALITQAIGVSRTINQALEIISELWEKRVKPVLSDKQLEYLYEGGKMLHKYL